MYRSPEVGSYHCLTGHKSVSSLPTQVSSESMKVLSEVESQGLQRLR